MIKMQSFEKLIKKKEVDWLIKLKMIKVTTNLLMNI